MDQALVETEQGLGLPQLQQQGPDLNLSQELLKKPSVEIDSFLVTNKKQFDTLLEDLYEAKLWAYDTETNGTFDLFGIRLVGGSFSWMQDETLRCCYVPLAHNEGEQVPINYALDRLKPLFEDPKSETICHNAKFDEKVLARHGIKVRSIGHDTYVMAWLLAEGAEPKGLKPLTQQHFGVKMETYEDVVSTAPKARGVARDYNFAKVSLEAAVSYATADAYWTYKLFQLFQKQLKDEGLWDAYNHVERQFIRILRDVELRGVGINEEMINFADQQLPKIIEEVEASIYREAKEVFNIGSSVQLGKILYEKLGIGKNVPKTGTGNYKTDKKTLTTYAAKHEIVANVLRRKKIQKTHSVFVEGLKGFVSRDGRIHPSFNSCGTVTGRLSCRSPNLQQIEGDEVEDIKIRDFFIPTPGYRFIVADYGQVELRVMAHFAKDQEMIDAFLSGRDFHDETARKMYKVPEGTEVTARQRFHAKAINFGIGYGRGPKSIAEQVNCTMSEAKDYIAAWHAAFPRIQPYKNHVIKQAREQGYIRTLTGRKRRLMPEILSDDFAIRGHAERQAFSTKIQGSAADIIKIAMISLQPKLKPYDAHLCLQIHDELVTEVPIGMEDEVLPIVAETMAKPFNGKNPLRLPLVVDPKVVDKWGDGK